MRFAPVFALAAFALVAVPTAAEMYRCEGPDGKLIFTGDASACPGAEIHAPARDVQRVGKGDEPTAEPAADQADQGMGQPPGDAPLDAPAKPRESESDAQADMWKRKRVDAENERRAVERDLAEFDEMITWCNRGGDIILEDQVGVRRDYSCAEANEGHDRLSKRAAELRKYLSGGLEEECRRDGCLPGWIR